MPRVLVFDVNETLLDLRALDEFFISLFDDSSVRAEWFSIVLRNAMTLTVIDRESDFVAVAAASLQNVAERHGITVDSSELESLGERMRSLPPHPDVKRNLDRLRDSGLRLAALTNSPQKTAVAQLTAAGVAERFERIMSVEGTGRFKPAREVYTDAAAVLGVPPEGLRMVAAHDWDIAGAMNAGYAGALITRDGTAGNPLFPSPDVIGDDLDSVGSQILAIEVG